MSEYMEIDLDEEDKAGGDRRNRLWLAVCQKKNGQALIEKSRLEDLREALNDPEILEVTMIYRAFRKEFQLETKIIRKLII